MTESLPLPPPPPPAPPSPPAYSSNTQHTPRLCSKPPPPPPPAPSRGYLNQRPPRPKLPIRQGVPRSTLIPPGTGKRSFHSRIRNERQPSTLNDESSASNSETHRDPRNRRPFSESTPRHPTRIGPHGRDERSPKRKMHGTPEVRERHRVPFSPNPSPHESLRGHRNPPHAPSQILRSTPGRHGYHPIYPASSPQSAFRAGHNNPRGNSNRNDNRVPNNRDNLPPRLDSRTKNRVPYAERRQPT